MNAGLESVSIFFLSKYVIILFFDALLHLQAGGIASIFFSQTRTVVANSYSLWNYFCLSPYHNSFSAFL